MDKLQQLKIIQEEVKDPTKPEVTNERKSWIRKWLDRAYYIVILWTVFAGLIMLAQIILLYLNKSSTIPGASAIYTSAGVIAATWVGGDQIVDRIQRKSE